MLGFRRALVACTMLTACLPGMARADEASPAVQEDPSIIVTGVRTGSFAGTKTDTPLIQTPQPISIIPAEIYEEQGALSIDDTLRYVSGVQASPYGLDSRVDGLSVRGSSATQYRDGMKEIFGYYKSITADPYNFSRVELVRGPASVLFGQGSIGGLVNLVSKAPQFETHGELALRYGSSDRKEVLADVTGPITDTIAARMVARVRDADTQTDYVPDDRVMLSPSIRFQPTSDTDITLIGLYQEDDRGSTAQFLPIIGTLYDNPNGHLPNDRFVGEPGYDRYDGRLLQGSALLEQRIAQGITLHARARYSDSDVDYRSHYPNSYTNPTNPYLDADQRIIGRTVDVSLANLNVLTTDANLQFDFNTGAAVQHTLLTGVDYQWNKIRNLAGYDDHTEVIDIYDPVYGTAFGPELTRDPDQRQNQLGFYAQDQIRFFDRVSVVLGVRHDEAETKVQGAEAAKDDATTFRAGIIGDIGAGLSPFFSYTQSFLPVAGANEATGDPYTPQRGEQFELGLKWQPDQRTLVTLTGYRIEDRNRLIQDPNPPSGFPNNQIQAGKVRAKGVEVEARRILPDDYEIIANYSYNRIHEVGSDDQLENMPKHNASLWGAKTFGLDGQARLRLGAGVRYVGANVSRSALWTIRTPDVTLVDAVASITRGPWRLSVNANNLLGKKYYAACLARGDCFIGAERNVFATLGFAF